MKSGKREALRLATLEFVFVTAAILWCCESNVNKVGGRDSDTDQPDPSTRFDEINGVVWFYNNRYDYRFEDIRGDLDTLHSAGFRILGFYAPYDGDKEKWHGCGPLDFYTPPPPCGSVEDFRALTSDAHDRGMKVVAYFAIIYIDKASEFFRTAEEQYAAGDRTSREVAAFHWTDNSEDPLPTPAAGPSAWQWSATAGAYFWSLWGEAGFDMNLAGARARVGKAELREFRRLLEGAEPGFIDDLVRTDLPEVFYGPGVRDRYAASWMLVHFLLHAESGRYVNMLRTFLKQISEGTGYEEAFRNSFGSDIAAFESAWARYVVSLKPSPKHMCRDNMEEIMYLAREIYGDPRRFDRLDRLHRKVAQSSRYRWSFRRPSGEAGSWLLWWMPKHINPGAHLGPGPSALCARSWTPSQKYSAISWARRSAISSSLPYLGVRFRSRWRRGSYPEKSASRAATSSPQVSVPSW